MDITKLTNLLKPGTYQHREARFKIFGRNESMFGRIPDISNKV